MGQTAPLLNCGASLPSFTAHTPASFARRRPISSPRRTISARPAGEKMSSIPETGLFMPGTFVGPRASTKTSSAHGAPRMAFTNESPPLTATGAMSRASRTFARL